MGLEVRSERELREGPRVRVWEEVWTWEVEEARPRLPKMGSVNLLALWVSASLNWREGGRREE